MTSSLKEKIGFYGSIFKDAFVGWSDDNIPRLGAALAYYTVFSLAPILVIAIAIAGVVFGDAATKGKVVDTFHGLLGPQGSVAVQTLLKSARQPHTSLIASIIGLVTLLIGSTAVFSELQSALNLIWGVTSLPGRTVRTAVKQRALSAALIMAIAFLLLVSLLVSTALTAVGTYLSGALPGGAALWQGMNFLISLGVTSALFALIFKILPDVYIAWKDVLVGAVITAVLFTLGKHLIGLYLGNSSASSVYGAAGSLVILLLWVYYSAQIFLIGAEFTKVYANRRGGRLEAKPGAILIKEMQTQTIQQKAA